MKLASRVTRLVESATLAVAAKAAAMKAQGTDVIDFGVGEPDFSTPDNVKQAGIDAIRRNHTRYPKPAHGILEARQAVCNKLLRENDIQYAPDQVIITSGGKMAFFLAMHALLDPGDEVIVPAPYWVSYPEIISLAGGMPVYVSGRTDQGYKITPQDIERALTPRTRAFVFNSPSNPGGFTYDPAEVRALAAVLTRHDVLVVADEIYDRLLYEGQAFLSYAAAGPEAFRQTLTLNAGSKTYAMTGWRIGYAAGPVEIIRAMARLQSQSTSGAATFTQHALAAALNGDQAEVETMRRVFERRAALMWRRLSALPGVHCPRPTGAFYCFPDVSGCFAELGVDGSGAFASRLLEEAHVAVVPGAPFGMDAHVRLSFALSDEDIHRGLDRIERFLGGR